MAAAQQHDGGKKGPAEDGKAPQKGALRKLIFQATLCVLCTLVGAFYPALLDVSKTAVETEVTRGGGSLGGGLKTTERRAYPFSPVTVVLSNNVIQLFIALAFVVLKIKPAGPEGLRGLFANRSLVLKMAPLGMIYALGELLTLRSVQKGSGPVYVVIANMKLVVAALMSRAFFGPSRSMPWAHWMELVSISVAAAAYTLLEAGWMGAEWHWEGAWAALAKSSLVAFSSVFCEHTYKSNSFVLTLTLQALWGSVAILLLVIASLVGVGVPTIARELRDGSGAIVFFGAGPQYPLCSSGAHEACLERLAPRVAGEAVSEVACFCLSHRGWDVKTPLTIVADLSNAVSSALVFKKLSAVAKYVCRATSAVPMYIVYCSVGRSVWDLRTFGVVTFLCFQVSVYSVQRHKASEAVASSKWTEHYKGTNHSEEKASEGDAVRTSQPGLRQRTVAAAAS